MRVGLSFGLGIFRFYVPLNRRRRARYWTHGTCTVHHRSPDAAQRCRYH